MSDFTARFERLELKFLIDELRAQRVRAQIAPYCTPDEHSQGPAPDRAGGAGYLISSLYLDTPGLAFHHAKERGDPNRIKLRVRTYSDTSPATLEIKRRRSDVIDKTRAVVDRRRVEDAANGLWSDAKSADFLNDFAGVMALSGAQPTLCVRYEREAYESVVDEYARITFDRHIAVQPVTGWDLAPSPERWCSFDEHWKTDHPTTPVVMEIKCQTATLPLWVIELVRRNALRQTSFSKYSIGIHLTRWRQGLHTGRSRAAQVLG